MSEHTQGMLEFAAIVTPLFLACFIGIIGLYTRLARIETKIEPLWKWWNKDTNGGTEHAHGEAD